MICKSCGKSVVGDTKFCPYCGAELVDDGNTVEVVPNKKKGPKKMFANMANIFGIIACATCWIPFVNLAMADLGIVGIVFGAISKKDSDSTVAEKGKSGMGKSIAGTILCLVLGIIELILYIVLIGVLMAEAANL